MRRYDSDDDEEDDDVDFGVAEAEEVQDLFGKKKEHQQSAAATAAFVVEKRQRDEVAETMEAGEGEQPSVQEKKKGSAQFTTSGLVAAEACLYDMLHAEEEDDASDNVGAVDEKHRSEKEDDSDEVVVTSSAALMRLIGCEVPDVSEGNEVGTLTTTTGVPQEKNVPLKRFSVSYNEHRKKPPSCNPFATMLPFRGPATATSTTTSGGVFPNRFGIQPGWRWDGVDRTNGFEQTYMAIKRKTLAD